MQGFSSDIIQNFKLMYSGIKLSIKQPPVFYAAFSCCFAAGCTKKFKDYNTNPINATEEMMQYDNLSTGVFFSQMEQNVFPTAQPPSFGDEMYQIVQNLAGDVYSGYMGASNNWFGGHQQYNLQSYCLIGMALLLTGLSLA